MHYLQIFLQLFFLVLFVIFLLLFLNSIINSVRFKVPQVGTFPSDFKVMGKGLKKYHLFGKKIADLGSGSGKALRFFEKNFGMKATGYEIDLSNVIISRLIGYILRNKYEIILGNYIKKDLSSFDVIYVYGFTVLMPGIEKKLWENCKKGTLVISNAFKMPNNEAFEVLLNDSGKEEVYIYKI